MIIRPSVGSLDIYVTEGRMTVVSLKDLIVPTAAFDQDDAFRFLLVMRNITVRQFAVAASSPLLMVNKLVAV